MVLLTSVFALSAFGLLMIYSATRVARELNQELASVDMERQMIFFTAGMIAMFVFSALDYREWRNFVPVIAGVTLVGLLVVFAFDPINGARRWIPLGPFALQPAEFTKVVAIVSVAAVLARTRGENGLPWRVILLTAAGLAVPAYLILIEPDLGTTMTFPFMLLAMLFAAGLGGRQFLWI
ncbi:MAG: FtsW/RodA/SpoVE family cell cycle protein, partial [Acidimicrobiia bacterium]|nr:FtsW/RodA/SpoVE family cell cycle protein [Acidimicrobiia bacterium]